MFTDTDSSTNEIEARDILKFLEKQKQAWNSDYPEDSPFYNKTNKKVVGKFKDETAGQIITEFVGLRSTMYSCVKDNGVNNSDQTRSQT